MYERIRVVDPVTLHRAKEVDLAQLARLDSRTSLAPVTIEPTHKPNLEKDAVQFSHLNRPGTRREIKSKRLFAEHMLPRKRRVLDHERVQGRRRCQHDPVDRFIGEQFRIFNTRDPKPATPLFGDIVTRVDDCGKLGICEASGNRLGVPSTGGAETDNAQPGPWDTKRPTSIIGDRH